MKSKIDLVKVEKTHGIENLLLLASQIDPSFAKMIEEGKKLTPYAVEVSYPLLIQEPYEGRPGNFSESLLR
ncbi:MAG TPA: hypothetical protein ENG66_00255 [Thermococcus sp.]|nr:hypothetical protein [Thermococcus sp.]